MKIVATNKDEQNSALIEPWTAVHFAAGLGAGLLAIPFKISLGASILYEIVEQLVERSKTGQRIFGSTHPEKLGNALFDIAVFAIGWYGGYRWNQTALPAAKYDQI
jgi:hypothetical protein